MTCNIFQDKTPMVSGEANTSESVDAPIRTAQMSKPGDKLPGEIRNSYMSVHNVERPRRGHDY